MANWDDKQEDAPTSYEPTANPDDFQDAPVPAATLTPHAGQIVYHCRRCDTHVVVPADELAGRDITKMCLCGRGTVVSEDGAPVSISQAWPVKPHQHVAPPAPDDPIAQREAAAKARRQQRAEWREFDS